MKFEIDKSIEVLERTPSVLSSLLHNLSEEWLIYNEGENTWSPHDVIGHLIHGEKTDWIVRARIILSDNSNKTFESFDRFAQMNDAQSESTDELLKEFAKLRKENLNALKALQISSSQFVEKGIHPELGEVNLKSLLSTWVVHDLGHIAQISRVMAKQYATEVGPWQKYLSILK